MRIKRLFWDDNNVDHLWAAHQVSPTEVEEIILGADGEAPNYAVVRDGNNYKVFGETGSGRLLYLVGEVLGPGVVRFFGARDMNASEKRAFRNR